MPLIFYALPPDFPCRIIGFGDVTTMVDRARALGGN
jgi:hypothetical protein